MDELLDILSSSGYGAMVGDNYCGAPMYADDLALIAESPEDLVSNYARRWHYTFNGQKSAILQLVFGEAPRPREPVLLLGARGSALQNMCSCFDHLMVT